MMPLRPVGKVAHRDRLGCSSGVEEGKCDDAHNAIQNFDAPQFYMSCQIIYLCTRAAP